MALWLNWILIVVAWQHSYSHTLKASRQNKNAINTFPMSQCDYHVDKSWLVFWAPLRARSNVFCRCGSLTSLDMAYGSFDRKSTVKLGYSIKLVDHGKLHYTSAHYEALWCHLSSSVILKVVGIEFLSFVYHRDSFPSEYSHGQWRRTGCYVVPSLIWNFLNAELG